MQKMKSLINFEFLQKFGKALMVVVAVMPAAGLAISLGTVITMVGGDIPVLNTFGEMIGGIGWGIIGNLHVLFSVAIGGTWAKERAGGAFAGLTAFVLINRLTGIIFGVTSEMLNTQGATTHTLFGTKIAVEGFFTSVLDAPALNMGVFVGIIAGFLGAIVYNKYYNFRKLPPALAFFNGKRFVPLVVIFWSIVASLVIAVIWPLIQTGLNHFGVWLLTSGDDAPFIAPFIYGVLERLLLPFGLHHMITVPVNYSAVGGAYTILTGTNAGTQVFGQDPVWLAWASDLGNLKAAGGSAYGDLLNSMVPARFKYAQMVGCSATLMGLTLAMYRNVDADKRKKYQSLFIAAAATAFLTGVTEPLEFMFVFVAPVLYVVYAIIQGFAFGMVDFFHLRITAFGFIETIARTPLMVKAGLTGDIINFLIQCVIFFVGTYFISNFMIKRFRLATPGRLGNYIDDLDSPADAKASQEIIPEDAQVKGIISLLGGSGNIEEVDACMTRLRVTVKNISLVGGEADWKSLGAVGLVIKDNGVQAIYGPKADVLKSDLIDALGM